MLYAKNKNGQPDQKEGKYYQHRYNPEGYSIFLDVSGSVGGSISYWGEVKNIIERHADLISNFYIWDSVCEMVSKDTYINLIHTREGRGGTSPGVVAEQIKKQRCDKAIIITDGQVGDADVKRCDTTLLNYNFSNVICYILATSRAPLNLSVTCPFTRSGECKVYTKKEDGQLQAQIEIKKEDYQLLAELQALSLEMFEAKFNVIEAMVIAVNMGKAGNIDLKNKLVVLKNRLLQELARSLANKKNYSDDIRNALRNGDFNQAQIAAQHMNNSYFSQNLSGVLERNINHLISLCGNLQGKFDIDQIKSNKMEYAMEAQPASIDMEKDIDDLTGNAVECPIIMDQDVPQILIDQGEPILMNVQKHIVDDITVSPLRLLNYPELKAKLKARLGNYIGVQYSDKLLRNPFTQAPLLGGLPLGRDISHVKVANHTLAQLFSGGKILGNLNMFFALVWAIITQGSIEYLKDVQANTTEHLLFRLLSSQTTASMSGQPLLLCTRVSTDVALWYCVNGCIFNQPADRDTFRFHLPEMPTMMRIVTDVLRYPIHPGVKRHLALVGAAMRLLSTFKHWDNKKKSVYKAAVKSIHQSCIQINLKEVGKDVKTKELLVEHIPIDGDTPNPEIIAEFLKNCPDYIQNLTLAQISWISSMMDAQKAASDIVIWFDQPAPPLPASKKNSWIYGLRPDIASVRVHPQTLRPLYFNQNGRPWYEDAEAYYGTTRDMLFSCYKYWQLFVFKYNRIPTTADQLLLFFYNRFIVTDKVANLPAQTMLFVKQILKNYRPFQTLEIEEIKRRLEVSRPIMKRIQIQRDDPFNFAEVIEQQPPINRLSLDQSAPPSVIEMPPPNPVHPPVHHQILNHQQAAVVAKRQLQGQNVAVKNE